jgi:hypothetical protein
MQSALPHLFMPFTFTFPYFTSTMPTGFYFKITKMLANDKAVSLFLVFVVKNVLSAY